MIVLPSIVNVSEPALTKKLVLGSTIVIAPEKLLLKLCVPAWFVPTKNVALAGMEMGLAPMEPGPPSGVGMNVVWAHAGRGNTIISQSGIPNPQLVEHPMPPPLNGRLSPVR